MTKLTPMMKQYLEIKSQYKDAFLFFRLGDFYELFYDDAIKAAQELEITLTKRDSGQKEEVPMCGVPHHSADRYIKTLVDRGYKVAICEQVEDPKKAKGVVKREVIQLITPGTVMEQSMLEETKHNYIASLSNFSQAVFVIVYHELSTGESQLVLIENGIESVIHELSNREVKEIVIGSQFPKKDVNKLKENLQVLISIEDKVSFIGEFSHLYDDLEDKRFVEAFSRLLNYIVRTQKRSLHHLKRPEVIELENYMTLDMYSKYNLELTETIRKKERYGSLLWVLDQTVTAMGARMLKKYLERPLVSYAAIHARLEVVEAFYHAFLERNQLQEALQSVYDLERLAGRISFGNVNARDLIQLKQSLKSIPKIKELMQSIRNRYVEKLNEKLFYPENIVDLLERSIVDDPPASLKEGNIIKDGYNEKLDMYREALRHGKKWILELEQKERERTNIKSLKVGYNRVFGYYIEVTHANKHLIPEDRYERKQTLRNAERYVTPELKEKEAMILEAEEKSVDLEYELFVEIREKLKQEIETIQQLASVISEIDVLQSFAEISEKNGYTRPIFTDSVVNIKESRHPVIEAVMEDGTFVPNDFYLSNDAFILLITGPNMAGKSTYMRQLALTVIMAQIGCFVPAEKAELPIFDQIFTRIGAADDLVRGQSTFMVEMLETNYALQRATARSLILLDEIGRGTSTFDGLALAQAIVEYIHDNIKAKTLFSTHYHELTELEDTLPNVKNIHVRAEEYENHVVFLHKVEEGRANESYGIHVAKLANLPETVIDRANVILKELETKEEDMKKSKKNSEKDVAFAESASTLADEFVGQLSFFAQEDEPPKDKRKKQEEKVLREIENLDLLMMTPIDAMNALFSLQQTLKKAKGREL